MTINIADVFPGLTRREREVCALLMSGRSNKEIGPVLSISSRTVEDHKYSIYRRLGVESVGQLLWKAYGCPEIVA